MLRTITTGKISLLGSNHNLPMLMGFQFENIVFGMFPKVEAEMLDTFGFWPNNPVGDIFDMLIQMLEICHLSEISFIYLKTLEFCLS